MYLCPICDSNDSDESFGALLCGHMFCWDCVEKLQNMSSKIPCPLCKQECYSSDVRKVYFNGGVHIRSYIAHLSENSDDVETELIARLQDKSMLIESLIQKQKELESRIHDFQIEKTGVDAKLASLRQKCTKWRESHLAEERKRIILNREHDDLKQRMLGVSNFNEAQRWMEKNDQELQIMVKGAIGVADKKWSQYLAVDLLLIRKKYSDTLISLEKKSNECFHLKDENEKLQLLSKSQLKEIEGLKTTNQELITICSKQNAELTQQKVQLDGRYVSLSPVKSRQMDNLIGQKRQTTTLLSPRGLTHPSIVSSRPHSFLARIEPTMREEKSEHDYFHSPIDATDSEKKSKKRMKKQGLSGFYINL